MTLASRFRNGTVPDLLEKYGEPATLLIPADPDSSADPWTPAPTPTSVSAQVAAMEIREMRRDGTLVRSTDWTGIMAANIISVPKEDASITIDGTTYVIIYVEAIRTQGSTVAYEIAARK